MSRFGRWLTVFVLFLGGSDVTSARTWTNTEGKQIEAELVRVSGNVAILNKGSEVVRAPIDQLSQADQEYLEAFKEIRKFRDWQIGGQTERGRYVEFRDGEVVIKIGSEERTIPLDELAADDRKMIEQLESLASTDSSEERGQPLVSGPAIGEVRSWTSAQGKEIEAEFRRVEGDRVVLFFRDKEWKFPLSDLSQADQDYIASTQVAQPDLNAMAGGPSREGVGAAMVDIRGRMNPGFGGGGFAPGGESDFAAAAQARHEQAMAEHEQRVAEMRARTAAAPQPPAPRQPDFGASRIEQPQINEPSIDHMASLPPSRMGSQGFERPNHELTSIAPPTPSIPEPPRFQPPPMPQMIDVWECGSCGKEIEGNSFKAGDKCPHCGVRFDYVEDENGRVTSGSRSGSGGRVSGRGIAAIISIVIGFFAWIGRKMFSGNE